MSCLGITVHECDPKDWHREPLSPRARLGTCGACQHGCCLRRHWHKPALCAQRGGKGCKPRWSDIATCCAGSRIANILVFDHRHFHQIRDSDHACGQPRRGRHPRAARLGQPAARQAEQVARDHGCDRSHRSDLALWRWLHHTGHFRAERDRGHQGRRSADGACRRPANGGDPRTSILDPAQRHGLDRRHIRAGHAGLVRGSRCPRYRGNCQNTRRARRIESFAGHHLSLACWAAGVCCDRRCLPRRDRWRSILRRHGAFRSISHSSCLVRRGPTCANS